MFILDVTYIYGWLERVTVFFVDMDDDLIEIETDVEELRTNRQPII